MDVTIHLMIWADGELFECLEAALVRIFDVAQNMIR
jgi:hypothetical protein